MTIPPHDKDHDVTKPEFGDPKDKDLRETLYLLSIPGMRESIREGMDTPVEQCAEDPGW